MPARFFSLSLFNRGEKMLGSARGKRRYDLPLGKGAGSGFLRLLIALMTVLAMLGLAASFALSEMTQRWSSGLENRMTVEIPAEDKDGTLIAADKVTEMTTKVLDMLQSHPAIAEASAMSEQEVRDLISPFLGEDLVMDSIPLPGLISVHIQDGAEIDLKTLETRLKIIAPQARIDTHESWLKDVLRFTGALQFAAILLTLIIAITTLVAVAGGVRSKMAVHREELQLLHLMGASDDYIARQLQRHTLILAFQGAFAGMIVGTVLLGLIGWLSGEMGVTLLPDFTLSTFQKTLLACLPIILALLAMGTARTTVLRDLAKMP
jgi:cell division transport system permease protein